LIHERSPADPVRKLDSGDRSRGSTQSRQRSAQCTAHYGRQPPVGVGIVPRQAQRDAGHRIRIVRAPAPQGSLERIGQAGRSGRVGIHEQHRMGQHRVAVRLPTPPILRRARDLAPTDSQVVAAIAE